MAVVKNTNTDYIITCDNGSGNLVINANVQIHGNVTYDSFIDIANPFITVAANNNGTIKEMGMLAQANANVYAGLRFNALSDTWEVSSRVTKDGTPIYPYVPLGSGTGSPGGPDLSLQFNANGVFSGTSNLVFDSANNSVVLDGAQFYAYQSTPPNTVSGTTAVYGNTPAVGNTGVYVSGANVSGELITAEQAFLYSIIF
jgi:hypothetical protein